MRYLAVGFHGGQPYINGSNRIALTFEPLQEAINQAGVNMAPGVDIVVKVTWRSMDAFQEPGEELQVIVLTLERFIALIFLIVFDYEKVNGLCRSKLMKSQRGLKRDPQKSATLCFCSDKFATFSNFQKLIGV